MKDDVDPDGPDGPDIRDLVLQHNGRRYLPKFFITFYTPVDVIF
jgi:hypothetical protein